MGKSLWEQSPAAKQVFAEADRATGLPLTEVCFNGPAETLTDTEFAQPGVVAVSLAAARALEERLSAEGVILSPSYCAGHSVGELAALTYAGALTLADGLSLVAARGRLMAGASRAANGTMAAVLGMDEASLSNVCSEASAQAGATVQMANFNAPGQLVISGNRLAVERASELARAAGAKRVIPLEVSGPFHSIYMQPAADGFEPVVRGVNLATPSVPVVLNLSGEPSTDPAEIRGELVMQVVSAVRWSDSVLRMADAGCTHFIELGPGQVLSGLVKRTAKDVSVLNVEDGTSLESTARELLQLAE